MTKPINYTCDETGVTFPKIYKIKHPRTDEYALTPQSQVFPGTSKREGVEVHNLGQDSGVDLHLSWFDSQEKASGYVKATKYWHSKDRVHPCEYHGVDGYFVLVAIKSESARGRIYFNTFKDLHDFPAQAVFNADGICVQHPSDH